MTSTNTYTNQTISYFYIIQHKTTKKLYAGSKWAKGCNPNTFMIPNGYTTSSPTINSIIENEGLDSFYILRIDTNLDGLSSYDYETLFLQCNDCANSSDWYNGHNNTGMAFGLPSFQEKSKQTCLEKYGVENAIQSQLIKEKSKQTCLSKYGVEYGLQSSIIREKSKNTMLDKYGVEYPCQNPTIQEKNKQTCLENSGYDNPSKNPLIKEKKKQTCLKNSGYDNPSKTPVAKEKKKQTCLKNSGYDNPSKTPVAKEKKKQTCLKNSGYDNPFKDPLIKEKIATIKRKYLLEKFECVSEFEIVEKVLYYEKQYNIKRKLKHIPNLKEILVYFPKTSHKSIKGLRIIYKECQISSSS